MKEELCEKVVDVQRKSNRVIAIALVYEKEVIRAICAYAPQVRRSELKKYQFYNDMASEWDSKSPGKLVLGLRDFNEHVGRRIDGFEGVHSGYGIGKRNVKVRRLLEFCGEKELCVANTWFEKKKQRKITYSVNGNETVIDFVLVGKNNRKYLKDVKAIPWDLQHWLVVTDLDRRRLKKVVKSEQTMKRRVWKLNENNMKTRFQKRVKELVDVDALNLWNTF